MTETGQIEQVDREERLAALVADFPDGPLAVDTEADSFHHYQEKVCLVQLSAGGATWLIDPLAGVDIARLAPLLSDARRRKILHGADYDVRILGRDFGLSLRGLYDTMVAARLSGETAVGLAALLEAHLGVRLDKSHQRADWSRRPLPEAMIAYAAEDTRHLHELAACLEEKLAALGRSGWAAEEFDRLERVRWREREAADGEGWRRVRGMSGLDRRGLAVLREVWAWRDATARGKDRPPFRVVRDEVLVALARGRPAGRAELGQVEGTGPWLLRSRAGVEVLEAVARGMAVPEQEIPFPADDRRPRPDPAFERRVAELKIKRDRVAKSLGLEPAVVAARGLLEAIQKKRDGGEDPGGIPELRAWQAELLRPLW